MVFICMFGIGSMASRAEPPASKQSHSETESPASAIAAPEEISRWVEDLSSNSYLRRNRASADLTRAGQPAVPELVAALDAGDLETTERVLSILQEIAARAPIIPATTLDDRNQPDSTAPNAWEELLRISTLGGSRGTRAKVATTEIRQIRSVQAIDVLRAEGVFIGTTEFIVGASSQQKQIVEIDNSFQGDVAKLGLLQWVRGIEFARVEGQSIRKEVLAGIVQLPDLKTLALIKGEIDGPTLSTLGDIAELRRLELRYVPMSGDLIDQLATLPIRVSLTLSGTDAPAPRVEALQQTVPGLEIIFKQGGFLGVQCLDNFNECMINEVLRGQGAERAGLLPGDVVIEVDGKTVRQFKDLQKAIDAHKPGETIKIRYLRGVRELETSAVLGKLSEQ